MGGVVKAVTKVLGGGSSNETKSAKPAENKQVQDTSKAERKKKRLEQSRKSALFQAQRHKKAESFLGSNDSLGDDDKLGNTTVLGAK